MQCKHYNAGIMKATSKSTKSLHQLTVRGIDAPTKQSLKRQAAQQGISVNQLVLAVVRQTVGTAIQSGRLARVRETLSRYPMPKREADKVDEALRLHDQLSLQKQTRDQQNAIFDT